MTRVCCTLTLLDPITWAICAFGVVLENYRSATLQLTSSRSVFSISTWSTGYPLLHRQLIAYAPNVSFFFSKIKLNNVNVLNWMPQHSTLYKPAHIVRLCALYLPSQIKGFSVHQRGTQTASARRSLRARCTTRASYLHTLRQDRTSPKG